jgi:rod shape-determining protein MreC
MNSGGSRSFQVFIYAFIVIGLIALALGGYLSSVTNLVLQPIVNIQTWIAVRYEAISNYLKSPQDINRLRQRNTELEAEVSRLQSEIIGLKQQISETEILSALVDFARVHPENQYIAASVIGRDPSPFIQYVIINRGSDDGLRRGMPVVTQQGLAGRVAAVTAAAARVQLITDPAVAINVKMEPSKVAGVLKGSLVGEVYLDMIPQSAEIQSGELVLTSGLGGNYPPDILIGQITGVQQQATELFEKPTRTILRTIAIIDQLFAFTISSSSFLASFLRILRLFL